jgi:hypothetical protein
MLAMTDVTAERKIWIAWLADRELPGPSARFREYVIVQAAQVSR